MYFKHEDVNLLNGKEWEKIVHANINQRKSAYNNIIPDTKTVAKEVTVDKILDTTDRTEDSKTILLTELSNTKTKLEEVNKDIEQAKASGDAEAEKEANNTKIALENGYNKMAEIYQNKFGESLIAKDNTQTTITQATSEQQPISTTQTQTGIPASTNPIQQQFANQMFMNNGVQTDWSAMLPLNVQQNLFVTA